jgi:hypothetical protein
MLNQKQFVQGDVLFLKVDELPKGLKKRKEKERVVFAEGEATGHAHATGLDKFIETYTDADDQLWAKLTQPKEVVHEEHGTVTLDPGIYRIGIVREVDPFSEEIRQVAD